MSKQTSRGVVVASSLRAHAALERAKRRQRSSNDRPLGGQSTARPCHLELLTGRSWKPVRYAPAGGPNQVVSASANPIWVKPPTHATYPSGRINTAVGAVTAPIAGSSHVPTYLASIN